jgi:hypothetical protein
VASIRLEGVVDEPARGGSGREGRCDDWPGRSLQVGDRIRVFGGFGGDPPWLHGGVGYRGTVERFIPEDEGDEQLAAVVRLDETISVHAVRGQVVVLHLAWLGTDWATQRPRVHVELCDFDPPSLGWQARQHGAWVESHATFKLEK